MVSSLRSIDCGRKPWRGNKQTCSTQSAYAAGNQHIQALQKRKAHIAVLQLLLFDVGMEGAGGQVQLRDCARCERIFMPQYSSDGFFLFAVSSREIRGHDARVTQPPLADKVEAELLGDTHDKANASRLAHEIKVGPGQLPHNWCRLLFLCCVQQGNARARAGRRRCDGSLNELQHGERVQKAKRNARTCANPSTEL